MFFNKFSIAICLVATTLNHAQISMAINSSGYVTAHNEARTAVGVGPISWDSTIAAYAQNFANQLATSDCKFKHSNGPYGENLAMGYGNSFNATEAIKAWVGEKKYYDYKSNSCVGGECRHYTQVVWRNSNQLGCGMAPCANGWAIISCNYYTPGNYLGERPY